jgi:hypothetical protein
MNLLLWACPSSPLTPLSVSNHTTMEAKGMICCPFWHLLMRSEAPICQEQSWWFWQRTTFHIRGTTKPTQSSSTLVSTPYFSCHSCHKMAKKCLTWKVGNPLSCQLTDEKQLNRGKVFPTLIGEDPLASSFNNKSCGWVGEDEALWSVVCNGTQKGIWEQQSKSTTHEWSNSSVG